MVKGKRRMKNIQNSHAKKAAPNALHDPRTQPREVPGERSHARKRLSFCSLDFGLLVETRNRSSPFFGPPNVLTKSWFAVWNTPGVRFRVNVKGKIIRKVPRFSAAADFF
jgi:hypothetical protein